MNRQTIDKSKFCCTIQYCLLLFLFTLLAALSKADDHQAVGYGYNIGSVAIDTSERTLTAQLHLIKASSVYGPDIHNLTLTASNKENSSGEVFLDEGEDIKMGGEGGKWSLVRFHSGVVNNKLYLKSKVVNEEFAVSKNWTIQKVAFLGLKKEVMSRISAYKLNTKSRIRTNFGTSTSGILEMSGLSILIGKEFTLDLTLSK